jgi:alpha-amylase
MKKYLLCIFVFAATVSYGKKVKFAVDMTGQVINATGMHISGDFQDEAGYPADWESNTTSLIQEGSTDIYSIVVDIPAFAKYEYKFCNGDQFYDAEFVPEQSRVGYNFNDNRWLYIDSLADDTTFIGNMLFAGNAPAGMLLLRTLVDMSQVTVSGNGIHLAGSFQGWNPLSTMLYSFGSNVYEVISYVTAGTYEYKFYNGNTTGDAETVPGVCSVNSSRSVTVSADTILPASCFSGCTVCSPQSIAEKNTDHFNLYPNPCVQSACMQFYANAVNRTVTISDASGRLVREYKNVSGNRMLISRNELECGLYIINVVTEGQLTSSGKLIIN